MKTTDSPKQAQFVVALLMLAFSVMSYFNRTIMSISGPEIIKEFSLSETQMGSIYSAFILSYALLMIPGGHLADRFGPRIVIAFMGLGSALFTGLTAVAGNADLGAWIGVVPAFILMRLAMGASTAPLYPSCARMNSNWFPVSQRARVWGVIAAGAGIGGAVSPLLFSAMINRLGWRLSFWASAGATVLLALVWLRSVRDRPSNPTFTAPQEPEPVAHRQTSVTSWWKERNLLLLTAGYFTVGYFEYIFFFWVYYYFGEIRKMGQSETAIYTTILFLMWTVMTPIGGYVSDRLVERYGLKAGRRIVPIVCLTVSALLLCVGVNMSHAFGVAACLSLALGFASASDGPYWATAIDLGRRNVGASSAVMNTGGNLGGFLAPILTPLIASYAGWSWGLYFGAGVVLIGVVIWFLIDPAETSVLETQGADLRSASVSPQLES